MGGPNMSITAQTQSLGFESGPQSCQGKSWKNTSRNPFFESRGQLYVKTHKLNKRIGYPIVSAVKCCEW